MIEPIVPVDLAAAELLGVAGARAPGANGPSFAEILTQGIEATTDKLVEADRLVAQYAVDGSVPLHQVSYALEEARLSFELMIQVRNRLLEASQQLMTMQV